MRHQEPTALECSMLGFVPGVDRRLQMADLYFKCADGALKTAEICLDVGSRWSAGWQCLESWRDEQQGLKWLGAALGLCREPKPRIFQVVHE